MSQRPLRLIGPILCLFATSCRDRGLPRPDFDRMVDQARYEAYEECEYFEDKRVMRPPPEGSIAFDEVLGSPNVTQGDVVYPKFPVPITQKLLLRGQNRFDIY